MPLLGTALLGTGILGPDDPTNTAQISGQWGPIITSMAATCGNEDVEIASTWGPITSSMAATMQGTAAAISGQWGAITSSLLVDHTAAGSSSAIRGQWGTITSAFRANTNTPVTGGSISSLLNFAHRPRHRHEDDEPDEAVEELPVAALGMQLTPEQQAQMAQQAQQAALYEQMRNIEHAKAVMRARNAAMLDLLSQV